MNGITTKIWTVYHTNAEKSAYVAGHIECEAREIAADVIFDTSPDFVTARYVVDSADPFETIAALENPVLQVDASDALRRMAAIGGAS